MAYRVKGAIRKRPYYTFLSGKVWAPFYMHMRSLHLTIVRSLLNNTFCFLLLYAGARDYLEQMLARFFLPVGNELLTIADNRCTLGKVFLNNRGASTAEKVNLAKTMGLSGLVNRP